MTEPLRIASPSDFLELMPFLLGYTPENALVVHGITNVGLAGPVMALPLPADPTRWRPIAEAVAPEFIHSTRNRGIDILDVVVCLYRNPQPGQSPEATAHLLGHMADWMIDAFVNFGDAPVKLVLGIVGNQWWDYSCHWPGCCEGEPMPAGDHPESITAQLRALGRTPGRPSSEIANEYRPTHTNAARHRRVLDEVSADFLASNRTPRGRLIARQGTLDIIDGALKDLRNGNLIGDEPAARIILGLQDRRARDRALSSGPEEDLPYERQLWADLARRCVPPYTELAPALLTLFAWVAWRQGDTATARLALREAMTINSNYLLAQHLHQGLNQDVPVDRFLEVFGTTAVQDQAEDEAALRTL
ncbi:DUF4192 domain-containing protein [Streptomyces sp. NPDC001795]|uniref:DUF4192 domain-containing protein n=1 Tax=Streptomyces sp. NPDC001795 TaxID=3154525 RepID=UPI00332FC39F